MTTTRPIRLGRGLKCSVLMVTTGTLGRKKGLPSHGGEKFTRMAKIYDGTCDRATEQRKNAFQSSSQSYAVLQLF